MKTSIKRNIFALLAVLGLALGVAAPVMAESLVQMSETTVSVAADKTVEGSAFLGGDNLTVDGIIKGDLFCAGNTITVNGTVEGDVICGANSLTIAGTVRGDIRVAGNTVILKGQIDGSASVAANSLVMDSSANVGRDLLVGSSTASLDGKVGRDVRVGSNQLTFTGSVGRNVESMVNSLVIAEGAKIAGNVHYVSETDGVVAAGAVAGTIQREAPSKYAGNDYQMSWQDVVQGFMAGAIFLAVMFIVFALFVVLVLPRYIRGLTDNKASVDLLKATLVGLVALVVSAPVMLLVAISGVGLLVSGFLFVAYGLAIILSGVPVAYLLGKFMLNGRSTNVFAIVGLGALVLAILSLLPLIGFLVIFVSTSLGLGLILMGLRSQYEGRAYRVEPVVVASAVKTDKPLKKTIKK